MAVSNYAQKYAQTAARLSGAAGAMGVGRQAATIGQHYANINAVSNMINKKKTYSPTVVNKALARIK